MTDIMSVWFGTKEEHNAIKEKNKSTLYIVVTDANHGSIGVI
jgi:hypothetical protein